MLEPGLDDDTRYPSQAQSRECLCEQQLPCPCETYRAAAANNPTVSSNDEDSMAEQTAYTTITSSLDPFHSQQQHVVHTSFTDGGAQGASGNDHAIGQPMHACIPADSQGKSFAVAPMPNEVSARKLPRSLAYGSMEDSPPHDAMQPVSSATRELDACTLRAVHADVSVEQETPAATRRPVSYETVDLLGRRRRIFPRNECARHCQEDDCWLIAHNRVYDVTKFLSHHPAGDAAILRKGGTDATIDFDFHSSRAQKMWAPFLIGYTEPIKGKDGGGDCTVS